MNETDVSYKFDSTDLLTYVNKRKLPLIIITTLALVVSLAVSLIITPQFKSTCILYPTSSTSVSNSLLSNRIIEKEILNFGEDEEVERLLQVLHSYEIRDRIIKKYNLAEHYDIDSSSNYFQTKLKDEFDNNISFRRTEFMSVEIEVFDKDKEMAAAIANNIADLVDTIMNKLHLDRALKAFKIVEIEYISQMDRIKKLEDSLTSIRKAGVIYYESMAETFNDAYAYAIANGKPKQNIEQLEEKLDILAEHGGAYVSLRDLLIHEVEKHSILESKYHEADVDVHQNLPYTYIVNRAEVADKKARPVRLLIVLISTVGTFLFSLFMLIVYDNIKKKTNNHQGC